MTAPIPVIDLHCDTADRIAWQTLPADIRATLNHDFYNLTDLANPAGCRELAQNHGHVSLEKIGSTPWAQCFACYIPDGLTPEQSIVFEAHVNDYMRDQLARNPQVKPARTADDVEASLDPVVGGEGPEESAIHAID